MDGHLYLLTGEGQGDLARRLLRITDPTTSPEIVADFSVHGLPFPTALLIDGRDRIYISVYGSFSQPSSGLVVRFDDLALRGSSEPPTRFTDSSR